MQLFFCISFILKRSKIALLLFGVQRESSYEFYHHDNYYFYYYYYIITTIPCTNICVVRNFHFSVRYFFNL